MEEETRKNIIVLDILPTNLRQFHYYFEVALFFASLALNSALIALLLTERLRELRDYTRVLLVNCVVDIFYTFAVFVTQIEGEAVDGRQVFILNGALASASIAWQYAALFTWTTALGASLACVPLVFVFRFFIFVRDRIMRNSQILALVVAAFAFGFHQAIFYVAAVVAADAERATVCVDVLNQTVWASGRIDNCLVTKRNSALLNYAAGVATVMFSLLYVTMVYCTLSVIRAMRYTCKKMSAKTVKLQRQMNKMLVIQMCLPLFTAVIPLGLGVTFPRLFDVYVPGLLLLSGMALNFIPLMSPLTTILFVSNFRRKFFRPLRRILPRSWESFLNATVSQAQINSTQTGQQAHSSSIRRTAEN